MPARAIMRRGLIPLGSYYGFAPGSGVQEAS